ncbi:MAG: DUF6036 family nucleotidyltransferase [Terriglobales bacterium]
MGRLGRTVRGGGNVFLVGGATAVLSGWRDSTIDVDLKADPEPDGFFEAVAKIKDELDLNVELASPDQFIPPLPGWRERSLPIGQYGDVAFYHYDPYSQALAKLQRGHDRDRHDLQALLLSGLIERERLFELFLAIEPQLIRFPAIDAASFRFKVEKFCHGS